MPSMEDLKQIFSREQPSYDSWSHSGNEGPYNKRPSEQTNPFGDSSVDESKVVGNNTNASGGGGANPFSDSYSMEESLSTAVTPAAAATAAGRNPFGDSPESKMDNNNNNNNHQHRQNQLPPRPSRHSWDSDREFPVMEISRIKRKTKKLRDARIPKDSNNIFREDLNGNGAVGGAMNTEAFTAVQSSPTNTTGGGTSSSPSLGRSVRKNKSWAWSTSDASASSSYTGSASASKQSRFPDSLDEVMNQVEHEISTVEGNNHQNQHANAGRGHSNTLKRVDEQHSVDSTVASNSEAARKAQQNLIQGFNKRGKPRSRDHINALDGNNNNNNNLNTSTVTDPSTEGTSTANVSSGDNNSDSLDNIIDNNSKNLTLHDLCGEATATDDIAWRNALYLLSVQPHLATISDEGWTPLHVCCLGQSAPPSFMVRALLYCNRSAARQVDEGDRLPLHLVAASSGGVEAMQLLVEEYPQGIYHVDSHGQTPLHLLIRNLATELTADKARVLLGLTLPESADFEQQKRVLQRRGEHLALRLEDLDRMLPRSQPVSTLDRDKSHEAEFNLYPQDVQMSLKKLEQWKKRQRKEGPEADQAVEVEFASADGETNPAAIRMLVGTQLPIHMLVRRAIVHKAPIESSSFFDKREEGEEEEDDDEVSSEGPRPSVPNVVTVLRLFAAAYPEGLVIRDARGLTPLLTALLVKDSLPSVEVVDILLGKRSPGYESPPEWALDMPLHRISGAKYMNPAMVPTADSNQLPLHVASEEMLSNYFLLESIHESYPGAIQIQDSTGKTPLHLALSNYRRIPAEPRVVSLLLSDRVAQIRDDDGNLPFDLLIESAHSLPSKQPRAWSFDESSGGSTVGTDVSTVYERFFSVSILGQARPNNLSEGKFFLSRLRSLPVWLRRQACTASFVQELLIEELSSPWKCAYVLFDGLLLGLLIAVFRYQIQAFVDSIESGDVLSWSWYTYAVYGLAASRLTKPAVLWVVSESLAEFQQTVILNAWYWIDGGAMALSIFTSVVLYGRWDVDELLALGTASTGLLWLSLIGYFASWWYGMAVLTGALSKIACRIVWPVLVACMLIVAFAQMFYTLLSIDCTDAIAVTTVCSVRDTYRVVYLLLRGESLVSVDGTEEMSPEAIILVALFLFCFALLLLALFVTILIAALQFDFEEIALGSYWEPKLSFILAMNELSCRRPSAHDEPSCGQRLMAKLELAWDLMILSLVGGESNQGKHWYASSSRSRCLAWPLWMLSIFVVPIWFVLGCATLGLLWPPQLRRIIFRPVTSAARVKGAKAAEESASQIARMRNEIMQLKAMSYDRSSDVHREIHDLKELLLMALKEE